MSVRYLADLAPTVTLQFWVTLHYPNAGVQSRTKYEVVKPLCFVCTGANEAAIVFAVHGVCRL